MAEKKRKQQSFEYGAIILLCSTALVKIIGAIFKIPLSRLIGDLGFGYFDSAYQLFTPIYSLSMAGLPIAISRVVAEQMQKAKYRDVRKSLKVTKRIFMVTGLGGFLLMLALIYPFVHFTDATGKTVYSLFAIAPSLFFCCIMSAYRGYYEGLRNMYPTAVSDVIEALGKLILGYGFAYIIMKITNDVALAAAGAMFGVMVGGAAAATFLTLRYKFKGDGIVESELQTAPEPESSKTIAKTIIAIAIPVVVASLANSVSSLVDVSMVKWQLTNMMNQHSDTIREMYKASISDYNVIQAKNGLSALTDAEIPTFLYGIRGKAFTLYNLVPTITSVLGVSALPVLATSWTKRDKPLIKRNIESGMKLTALIAMPAGLGFAFLGPEIMSLMYNTTASVEIGGVMLRIYGLAAFFAGLAIPMTSMLQAIGKEKISLRNVAIGAGLKVVVNFIFVGIPSINIKGAAIGTFVSYLFIFTANLLSLIKYTGIKPNFYKTMFKPFVAALACGLSTVILDLSNMGGLGTIIEIAVAAVVYFVVLIIFNTFEPDDVLSLPKGEKLLNLLTNLKIIR
ncbi:MAG: polysaccharide biosynthesis protein [Acutalibacteraceae bacterium]|nr:polysaccharide biosynthesis protein [Acutalibacteraceae bacterium]